jgi:hypothetical protein
MAEWIGLLFEVVFFALGLYLYLYALGKINLPAARAEKAAAAERFRQRNRGWMRILALAMMAIFGLNIALHLRALL